MGGGGGVGGGRGGGGHSHSPGGRGKLPSLLSHRVYTEGGGQGAFQHPGPPHAGPAGPHHDFPGRHFGGGPRAGRQRGRKRPPNRQQHQQQQPQQQQQEKPQQQRDGQKKRKQTLTAADEPESKMNKTDAAGTDTATEPADKPAEKNGEAKDAKDPAAATKASADGDKALTMQEEISQMKKKLQTTPPGPGQDKAPKPARKRRGFLERSGAWLNTQRVMFACSVCKFRSFYKEDMAVHLDSRFHKDHFKYLSNQLSKPTTDFLQEYLLNKYKKTEQRTSQMENHSAVVCQVYKEQDLTRELGMEHFMRKVEAAHCAACDLFIPMQQHLIQKHLKSADHNYNRKGMMEQSKRASLSVARSILNHKVIGKKLESYLKGENPFTGNQDEHDPEDSMVMEVAEATNDSQAEATNDSQAEATNDSQAEAETTTPVATQAEGAEPEAGKEAEPEAGQGATELGGSEVADGGIEEVEKMEGVEATEEGGEEEGLEATEGGGGKEEEQGGKEEEHKEQEPGEKGGVEEEEEEGFEVGDEVGDEEGFIVDDEIGDEGIQGEEEEGGDGEELGVEGEELGVEGELGVDGEEGEDEGIEAVLEEEEEEEEEVKKNAEEDSNGVVVIE